MGNRISYKRRGSEFFDIQRDVYINKGRVLSLETKKCGMTNEE